MRLVRDVTSWATPTLTVSSCRSAFTMESGRKAVVSRRAFGHRLAQSLTHVHAYASPSRVHAASSGQSTGRRHSPCTQRTEEPPVRNHNRWGYPAGPCGENAERQRQRRVPFSRLARGSGPAARLLPGLHARKIWGMLRRFPRPIKGASRARGNRARLASFVRQAVIPPTSAPGLGSQRPHRHRDWLPSLSLLRDLAD